MIPSGVLLFHHDCLAVSPSDVLLFHLLCCNVPPFHYEMFYCSTIFGLLFHHQMLYSSTIGRSPVLPIDVPPFHHDCSTFHHQMFYCSNIRCSTIKCSTVARWLFHYQMLYCSTISVPLFQDQWNIWWWNSGTSDCGIVENLMLEEWKSRICDDWTVEQLW